MVHRSKLIFLSALALTVLRHRAGATPVPSGSFHFDSGLVTEPVPGTALRAFVGVPVVLDADGAAGGFKFDWDISDGTHLTGSQVTHAFSAPGVVTISLTVTDLSSLAHTTGSTIGIRVLPNFSQGDPLVSFGGNLGNWGTELLLSNPTSQGVTVGLVPVPYVIQGCPALCPFTGPRFVVPPFGTAKSPALPTSEGVLEQLSTYYFVAQNATSPSIRVRAVNTDFPNLSNGIPVVHLSSLILRDPSVLSFPGATSGAIGHSDLVLAGLLLPDLSVGPPVSGEIEVRDAGGNLLASVPFSVDSGDVLILSDVVRRLGISDLMDGQIRVLRTSLDGYMWGVLATTYRDGSLAISTGSSP